MQRLTLAELSGGAQAGPDIDTQLLGGRIRESSRAHASGLAGFALGAGAGRVCTAYLQDVHEAARGCGGAMSAPHPAY